MRDHEVPVCVCVCVCVGAHVCVCVSLEKKERKTKEVRTQLSSVSKNHGFKSYHQRLLPRTRSLLHCTDLTLLLILS